MSTRAWRLRPLIFLPASYPRGPPASVVLTLWLSRTAAEGLAARPRALAIHHHQGVVYALEHASVAPSGEPAVGGAPGDQVGGHLTPRTP